MEMTHPLTPREKVRDILLSYLDGRPSDPRESWLKGVDLSTDAILTALASGSGDHAELARLAEAATKGPWFETEGHPSGRTYGIHAEAGPVVVFRGIAKPHGQGEHNAAFIAAANPSTVLALLAEISALRAKLAEDDLSAQAEEEEYASKVLEWESVACLRGLRSLELERELSEHRIAADLLASALKADKEEAKRKLAEAVGLMGWARDELPEINPSNYDHEDACHLNAKSVEVTLAITSWLSKEAERG